MCDLPDGQITSCSNCAVSIPSRKNISLHNSDNPKYMICVHPTEGRYANVTNAGLDAMDAKASLTSEPKRTAK
jgi:hypothetical protein